MPREVKYAPTPFGEIAYTDRGQGPSALFVHGVFLNGHLWRHVIDRVAGERRCIAIDLLAHGATRAAAGADVSFTGQARMLKAFCDRLELDQIDLVANDSGGAVAQIFAANHPERIRSLTLTNCDVHDNYPPKAFEATRKAVADGQLGMLIRALLGDLELARSQFAIAYEHPERLEQGQLATYLQPFIASAAATHDLERWFEAAEDHSQTVRIEPLLRKLAAPTLVVWGTADPFFGVEWAHWLRKTIPGTRKVVELAGAKLFFPEERPDELVRELREHWSAATVHAAP